MTNLNDILNVIPCIQVGVSLGLGFYVGAARQYQSLANEGQSPYNQKKEGIFTGAMSLIMGTATTVPSALFKMDGAVNYAVDIGSCAIGMVAGRKTIDSLARHSIINLKIYSNEDGKVK